MYLALDVHYKSNYAKCVGVTFFGIDDNTPHQVLIETLDDVAPYEPGEFYKRELPCLLKVISKVDLKIITAILVDGYVFIDNNKGYGLGGYLYEALVKTTPIIGIAKSSFHANEETVAEVFRGKSKNPLYISAIGLELQAAAQCIQNMHGAYRIPTLLKTLDNITKQD